MEETSENLLEKRDFDKADLNPEPVERNYATVKNQKWVLISDNSGRQMIVNLKKEKKVKWKGKFWVNLKGIADGPLPNYFRSDRGQIEQCTKEIVEDLNREHILYDQNKNNETFQQDNIKGTNETIYQGDEAKTQT